jgi:hypothetical protein
MPLMRYFVFVGGALLALLFIVNAFSPPLPATKSAQSAADLSVIRIHSDTKWPEAVVFDTTRPTITPAAAPVPVIAETTPPPQKNAGAASQDRMRQAFAEAPANPSRSEPKRKRKSVAKNYFGPQRMVVAQQPTPFFFGSRFW